jgi:hypothetical protein
MKYLQITGTMAGLFNVAELIGFKAEFLTTIIIFNYNKMKNLIFEATKHTPRINFDHSSGIFEISGRSIPENAYEFYKPILEWLDAYRLQPQEKTILRVYLEYYNTSSSKYYLDIFRKFEAIYKEPYEVLIEWYYDQDDEDDEDMMKAGEDYSSKLKVPFETKKYRSHSGSKETQGN